MVVVVAVVLALLALTVGEDLRRAIAGSICEVVGLDGCEVAAGDDEDVRIGDALPSEPDAHLPEYCVTDEHLGEISKGAIVSYIDVGDGFIALAQRRSNGEYAVTITEESKVGLATGVEGGVELYLGEDTVGLWGSVGAGGALIAQLGETWVLDDAEAADRFVRNEAVRDVLGDGLLAEGAERLLEQWDDLWHDKEPVDPELESTSTQAGVEFDAEATGTVGAESETAALTLEGAVARSRDTEGNTTASLVLGGDADVPFFDELQSGSGEVVVNVTFDDTGTLTELNLVAEHASDGSPLPEFDSGTALDHLSDRLEAADDGERVVFDMTVDVQDEDTGAAAEELVEAMVSRDAEVGRAAVETVLRNTQMTAQVWDDVEREYGGQAAGRVDGVALGGELSVGTSDANLTHADVWNPQEPGWETWDKCFG